MSGIVEIKESQSARLQKIASEKGVTPDALLEEALELLFQRADREQAMQEEQALLSQLQAGAVFPPRHESDRRSTARRLSLRTLFLY